MTRTWGGTGVNWAGRYATLEDFSLKPLPVQKPRPPIWVSGRRRTRPCAAPHAMPMSWLPYMYARDARGVDGGDPTPWRGLWLALDDFTCGIYLFFAVHEDHDIAVRMAADKLGTQYAQDFSKLVHKYALAGDRALPRAGTGGTSMPARASSSSRPPAPTSTSRPISA